MSSKPKSMVWKVIDVLNCENNILKYRNEILKKKVQLFKKDIEDALQVEDKIKKKIREEIHKYIHVEDFSKLKDENESLQK